ncbi:hypothetical protein ACNFCJ_21985, partial [Pseudomonas sp. NY15364]|uniref:hypothetical protein n=1 Tax=Pseudomonas sp. NY15364 TaxID=3400353 RepID=UPI003A85402C
MKEEFTAIDMATAAADGFRAGQRAANAELAAQLSRPKAMTQQCVNCPGAEDHSTAQCPLVSEQSKIDAERAAFEFAANQKFYGGLAAVGDTWSEDRGMYVDPAHHMAWWAWQQRTSLPVGVPDGYRWHLVPKEDTDAFNAACSAANDAHLGGVGPCGVFIAGYRAMLAAAPAAPTVKAEQVQIDPSHRALIKNAAGLLRIRRPVAPDVERVAADLELMLAGHAIPAEKPSREWLEVAELADQAPSLPAAGSAVEEVEAVAWQDADNPMYTTAERRVML